MHAGGAARTYSRSVPANRQKQIAAVKLGDLRAPHPLGMGLVLVDQNVLGCGTVSRSQTLEVFSINVHCDVPSLW